VGVFRADGADLTAGDPQRGFLEIMDSLAEQGAATFDQHVGHDAAP
jgi:hypothetical protein